MKKGHFCIAILSMGILLSLLTGCNREEKEIQQQKIVKLMFLNEDAYRREYANVVEYKYPELKIEIVPYTDLMQPGKQNVKTFIEFVQIHKPDIISILPIPGLFETMIQEGYLHPLDQLVTKHRFDLGQYAPLVTNLLRDKGQGSLYGLPPSFSTTALYFNKDLFDRLKIEYPRNGMSFKDVLDLAYRFTRQGNGEPIVGFYMKNMTPRKVWRYAGDMEGLQWIDANGQNMTIQTAAWEKVFSNVVDAYRSGAMFDASLLRAQSDQQEWIKNYEAVIAQAKNNSLFATGKAAMTIDSPLLINDINRFQPGMDWDLVSLPSNGGAIPSNYVQFQTVHSIASGTSLAEESWNVLQLLHSDQMEKTNAIQNGVLFNKLPVRMKNISFQQKKNLEAFYSLRTAEKGTAGAQTPSGLEPLIEQMITDLLDDKLSVSDALRVIQEQGNVLLLQDRGVQDE